MLEVLAMKAIHQIVAGYADGDAISNEARTMRGLFRSWGFRSEIYAELNKVAPALRRDAKDLATSLADFGPGDVALLHLSSGSVVNDIFPRLPAKKVIRYHNITPAEYFRFFQEQAAAAMERGRRQAKALHDVPDLVLSVSAFNARELAAWGYPPATVFPLLLDFTKLRGTADAATLRKYRDGLTNILFVGRCAPNKRIEDVLNAFYYFQRFVQPASRLLLPGGYVGMEQYRALLLTRARSLQLKNVSFLGSVPQSTLLAAYQSAHAFLCMSDHEGFCIPLLEAMVHRVPVFAYAAGAVEDTLDGAGILFREKNFDAIAETMGRVLEDQPLREAILAGQDQRLARYEALPLAEDLRRHLAPLL